jgi:thiamine-monophosphate kinase
VTVADLTERDLVARLQQRLSPAPDWMVVGIGDDAAVVETERDRLEVLTVDASIEGVHFDRRWSSPSAVGHRALAVNLSDLAAMGASPRLALLSLALPPSLSVDDFDAMIEGLAALASLSRMHLAGGNLTRSPGPLVLDLTAIGSVKRRQVLTRAGARPGDEIYVTGTLGAALAGLQYLREDSPAGFEGMHGCVERYLRPTPPLKAGVLAGRNRAASACMDLSDGLADAVRQVAQSSGVGATIDLAALPVEPSARAWFSAHGENPAAAALAGGDDYELLFTVTPKFRRRFLAALKQAGTAVTRVGICTPEPALRTRDQETFGDLPGGFTHFR